MRRLALVLLALLVAGCLQPSGPGTTPVLSPTTKTPTATPPSPGWWPAPTHEDGVWRVAACDLAPPSSDATAPDLLVALEEEGGGAWLQRLSLDAGAYAPAARSDVALAPPAYAVGGPALASMGDDVYAYGGVRGQEGQALLHLDALTLEVRHRVDATNVVAMAAHEGVLYVAGDWLRAYDRELRLLGEIELPLKESWAGKMAHDIIVHEGVAYLIDDVVMPLFILRVDVTDPAAMQVIDRRQISGGHLPGHWLDLAQQRWIVLDTWGGRGAGYQSVNVLPLGAGDVESSWTIQSTEAHPADGSNATHTGYTMLATTDTTPLWVLAGRGAQTLLGAAHLDIHKRAVTLCAADVDLPRAENESTGAFVERASGTVAAAFGRTLVVVDETAQPYRLVASQALDAPVRALRVLA